MKNIKTTMAMAAAAAACAAFADVLYWKVSDATFITSGQTAEFSYATVRDGTNVSDPMGAAATIGEESQYYKLYTIDAANNATAKSSQYQYWSNPSAKTSTLGDASWFGDIDGDVSSLMFELWGNDNSRVGYINVGRSAWSGSLDSLGGMSTTSATPFTLQGVVPEPTSGLLLLLGAAGLALRRRRRDGLEWNGHPARCRFCQRAGSPFHPRRSAVALAAALICAASFAAQNDALVTFSTKGPDKYADGTTVLDGERYALVWSPAGSAGVRIAADGTVEGGEIVLVAPVAKGGRCPATVFQIDAALAETRYAGGTWGIYLLDTRDWGADGVAKVRGAMACVNAAGLVPGSSFATLSGTGILPVDVSYNGLEARSTYADTPTAIPGEMQGTQAKITAIRIEGGNVFVTAKGTFPCLQYELLSGDRPDGVAASAANPVRGGADTPEGEVVFVAPAKKGAAFFKVGRK